MLTKLFSRKASRALRSGPSAEIPPGIRVYAIGDIHGRLDLLDEILHRIAADDAARPPAETQLILLGDLIDRGPESAQVVERLRQLQQSHPCVRSLCGNHEEVFLNALSGDERALRFFTRIGGRETILSYGITEDEFCEMDYPALMQALQRMVPAAHIDFLSAFEDVIILGDYAFVHAGVDPGTSLAQQRIKDLRWIRESFINHEGTLEKVIVHGHTISDEVEQLPHRIGLDTGAFASGRLSAMGFENGDRWILNTRS
ncbi:metallophosphoesterase family protein [Sphingomonas sp. Root241]|uniref:metallophosphoesterase family protein n=1 Tax=Sphingomonas sp. Root241 TaxID=1736501 RepID=UPI0006F69BAD|nr:metallophosphoesterase family protein [Sphingomonas sp. Root241]KRC81737.1 serine/threonine protein phosphatase [Sphingomonas sp. Root241]